MRGEGIRKAKHKAMTTINSSESAATQARYSTGAIVLHWLIAIGVIVNWRLAEAGHHLEWSLEPLQG